MKKTKWRLITFCALRTRKRLFESLYIPYDFPFSCVHVQLVSPFSHQIVDVFTSDCRCFHIRLSMFSHQIVDVFTSDCRCFHIRLSMFSHQIVDVFTSDCRCFHMWCRAHHARSVQAGRPRFNPYFYSRSYSIMEEYSQVELSSLR